MSNSSKPAIPAWQQVKRSSEVETEAQQQEQGVNETNSLPSTDTSTTTTEDAAESTDPITSTSDETSEQHQQVRRFLDDAAVKNSPIEKQRAFLQSKGIPDSTIDEHLSTPQITLQPSEFSAFQQESKPIPQSQAQSSASRQSSGPPIITYPEFLADAHRAPPLITPARIIGTAYVASAAAALLYGMSTFLVSPMAASLTDSRHNLATHSQSKIDEMNERLMKLVSKIPESRKEGGLDESDETDSLASDPTELFHRDMGTQTSPPVSRSPSSMNVKSTAETKDVTEKQRERLAILQSHLSEILSSLENGDAAVQQRHERSQTLRHYLDTMQYSSNAVIHSWGNSGSVESRDGSSHTKSTDKEDAIEGLKKEIRGVKGVLLSAKRFPSTVGGGRNGG